MTITANSIVERSPDRPYRSYLKGVVIEPGLTLNESAAALYLLLDGQRTLKELCAELQETYDAGLEMLIDDAVAVCTELMEEGAVRGAAPSS